LKTEKIDDLFSLILLQIKKYHPSVNIEFNNSGIPQSLKFRILMEKILKISLKLNFSPNTLGYYGLNRKKIFNDRGNQMSVENRVRPTYILA